MTDEQKFAEFLKWDRERNSTLSLAFEELDKAINAIYTQRIDGVMGTLRVMATALIALKEACGK